jgi:hypothetical protein
VLGYGSMIEESNLKLEELLWEHFILYNWTHTGNTRHNKIDLVWENIWKGLNELGKIKFIATYSATDLKT